MMMSPCGVMDLMVPSANLSPWCTTYVLPSGPVIIATSAPRLCRMPRTEISAVVIPTAPSPRLPVAGVGSEPVPSRFRNGSRRPCGEYEYASAAGGGGGVGGFSAGFAGLGAGGVDAWGAGAAPWGAGAGFAGDGFCAAGGCSLGADTACSNGDACSAVASAIGATRT